MSGWLRSVIQTLATMATAMQRASKAGLVPLTSYEHMLIIYFKRKASKWLGRQTAGELAQYL